METLPLFDDPGPVRDVTPIPDGLSVGQRRTLRKLQLIELGRHPISGFLLHPNAPADASSKDRYVRDFTCGSCAHRVTQRGYPKCDLTTMSHTEATDTYRWYPGCMSWRPVIVEPTGDEETHDGQQHSGPASNS